MSGIGLLAGALVVWAALVGFLILFFAFQYKRCPADQVLVVTGSVGGDQKYRFVLGRGAFIWPLIQTHAFMSLAPLEFSVPVVDVPGYKSWSSNGELEMAVRISTEPSRLENAAENLISLSRDQIAALARGIISTELRANARDLEAAGKAKDQLALFNAMRNALEGSLGRVGLEILHL